MKKISFKRFFTLIELIVVIVVLGIFAAIVIPNISSFKEEAQVTAMISDERNIQTAIDMYQLDNNGQYPTTGNIKPTLGVPDNVDFNLLKPEYLRDLPKREGGYYQVDYQGQVYYNTIDNPTDFQQDETNLTWTPNEKATGYDIHEVVEGTTSSSNGTKVKLVGDNIQGGIFMPEGYSQENTYLISVIDQYEFKAAPVIEGYTGSVPFNKDDLTELPSNETPIKESELDQLVLGDFVQFGKHLNGEPMKWNVVKKENGEVMLFMTEPIRDTSGTLLSRSFDLTAETGEADQLNRNKYGSNNWKYSDIRDWLNGSFYNGAFENKNLIADSTHDYILAGIDSAESTSGTANHIYDSTYTFQNYRTAYKNTVTDKVFLVGIDDIVNVIRPVIGSKYHSMPYWTKDSVAAHSYQVRNVHTSGNMHNSITSTSNLHVRAALTLASGELTNGVGSSTNPYIIE